MNHESTIFSRYFYLQDESVGEGDIGGGTIDGRDERRIHDFGADFGQTEDGKATIIATIFKVIRVLPHERESQVSQTESRRAGRLSDLVLGLGGGPGRRLSFARLQLAHVDIHAFIRRLKCLGRFERLTGMLAGGQQFRRPFADADFHVNLLFQIVFLPVENTRQ